MLISFHGPFVTLDPTVVKFLRTIEKLLSNIQQEFARIRIQHDPGNGTEHQQPPVYVTVHPHLEFPVSISKPEPSNKEKWSKRFKAWIELAALGAAIWIGILNLGVLNQIKQQTPKISLSADAATKAANTSERELEVSERPWVTTDFKLLGPLVFDKSGVHTTVSISIKNVGRSPAIHVYPILGILSLETAPLGIKDGQRGLGCGQVLAPNIDVGTTIFPNGSASPYILSPTLSPVKIQEGVDRIAKDARPGSKLLTLHLLGCIVYESSFKVTPSPYETGFSFALASPDRYHPGAMLPTEVGKSIPLPNLRLFMEFMQVGSYAQ